MLSLCADLFATLRIEYDAPLLFDLAFDFGCHDQDRLDSAQPMFYPEAMTRIAVGTLES